MNGESGKAWLEAAGVADPLHHRAVARLRGEVVQRPRLALGAGGGSAPCTSEPNHPGTTGEGERGDPLIRMLGVGCGFRWRRLCRIKCEKKIPRVSMIAANR